MSLTMTSAMVVEMSVTTNNNTPPRDYITLGFKSFTLSFWIEFLTFHTSCVKRPNILLELQTIPSLPVQC